MSNFIFFVFSILCFSCVCPCEFLYPVATYRDLAGTTKILVSYQRSLTNLELWSWDPLTCRGIRLLPAHFTPAGVRMLPNDIGFSFIDNDTIRIKQFEKRSVLTIDTFNLSNMGLIWWDNSNELGYFHAKDTACYSIFSLTMQGDIACCIQDTLSDCMYPCCVDSTLFYIQRLVENKTNYRIVEQSPTEINSFNKTIIADFQDRPIIFLTMLNNTKGFVVEHAAEIDTSEVVVKFAYYCLEKMDQDHWKVEHLFSFSLPTHLLLKATNLDSDSPDTCLYESVLPLLPKIKESREDIIVYYVDTDLKTGLLIPYRYGVLTHKKNRELLDQTYAVFVPLPYKSTLLYGGPCTDYKNNSACFTYYDEEDEFCISFLKSLKKEIIL